MEKRKMQSKLRYVLAFLIGTFIFVNGFVLTYAISYFEYQRISDIQGKVSYQIFQDKLKYSFFDEDICSLESLKGISEDLRFQGKIIDDLERKLGKNDKRVLFRKKFYTLIELEHLEFIKEMNKKCNLSISIILFFYSNEDEDIDKSEDAGKLLDAVNMRNEDLVIYSFDINLGDDLVKNLKEKYGVEVSPTMIINEENKIISPENIEELEECLG